MSADMIIGIDLGTTFSAVAYVNKHGQPEIIQNIEGDLTTGSIDISAHLFDFNLGSI
jgi:molecular chaperone DnaK